MTRLGALLVEPGWNSTRLLMPLLAELGFSVTAAENFHEAKQSLHTPPRLLVTDVKLGEFNGLHLVLRGMASQEDMAAIVTSDTEDLVLRAEAEAMGAAFLVKPVSAKDMAAAVARTVCRRPDTRFIPIRAPFERRLAERRAKSPAPAPVHEHRSSDRRSDLRHRLAHLFSEQVRAS